MDLADLISRFSAVFHHGEIPATFDVAVFEQVGDLEVTTPLSYRALLCSSGGLFTPTILEEIVDRQLDFPDVQNIWLLSEVARDTRDSWSGGMPQDMVGFANDAGGNYFCYPRRRHRATLDDAPVWFFDHESIEAHELSPSLAAWLAWYLDNLRPGT